MKTIKTDCCRIATCVHLAVLLLFMFVLGINVYADESSKTKQINIVYDDSGSMYGNTTKWSEAKYATEVFAAMMGSNDTISIFPMSSYNSPIILKGSEKAASNVNKVINMKNSQGGTPFDAVRAAAKDIMLSNADDKWLVVLTDGEFNGNNDKNWPNELLGYVGQNDVKVIYTTIGLENILSGEKKECFYPYQAEYDAGKGRSSILETMTNIAALVFNYRSIPLTGVDSGTVSFDADVPLSKVIVFSQGGGSGIGEIQVGGAPLQDYDSHSVDVKLDEKNGKLSPEDQDLVIAQGLNGEIYTAAAKDEEKPFPDGKYSFSCNTDNVQVFVEPGVLVEATLRSANGEAINLEDNTSDTIPEGDWIVDVQMINPLTGQPIDPSKSDILKGSYSDVVVKSDDGTIKEYTDGETITVEGDSLELYGRTTFQGAQNTIEKTSKIHKFKIKKGSLVFTFNSPGGYTLDAVMLQPDQDIIFTVTAKNKQLTPEEAGKLKLDVKNTQGIKWKIEPVNDTGTFRLIPEYAKSKGLKAVTPGSTTLEVSGSAKIEGDKRKGNGAVKLNIIINSKAKLHLDLSLPEEQSFDSESTKKYMFDARVRGVPGEGEERPYILVTVLATDSNGNKRPLSAEEWESGLDGFSYNAQSVTPGFQWKLIKVLTIGGQRLDFKAVRGSEPSTYKLYLDGLSELNVLPNTSDLQVELKIKYDNGVSLTGTADGVITVKPLAWWRYILYFIVLTAVSILLILILIRELTKPRIPRDFKPHIVVLKNLAGTPQPPLQPEHYARFRRYQRWSLWKPEKCRVVFDSRDTNIDIPFTVVAIGQGMFRIENISTAFMRVKRTVKLSGQTYEQAAKNPNMEFEVGDIIRYTKTSANVEYKVTLTF